MPAVCPRVIAYTPAMRGTRVRVTALLLVAAAVTMVSGQQIVQTPFGIDPLGRFPRGDLRATSRGLPAGYTGQFQFCRLRFRNAPDGDGGGWFVDYPRADENLSSRLSEVTKIRISADERGRPRHMVTTASEPDLLLCPFIMMTEPGGAYFDEDEAEQLRTYLLKGGFLWADDSWGSYAWDWWRQQLAIVLPGGTFPVIDLPMDHPLFHTLFNIERVPQIPNVGLWVSRHQTSERGPDSPETPARAVLEPRTGRVMVFMTHNTDFGDAYEEEAVSPDYFRRFSTVAYAIGADIVVYAMTH